MDTLTYYSSQLGALAASSASSSGVGNAVMNSQGQATPSHPPSLLSHSSRTSSSNLLTGEASLKASSSQDPNLPTKFEWNCEPLSVVCIFPYVVGFGKQCIEIRLLINGNLINSITMSNIKLIAGKVNQILVYSKKKNKYNKISSPNGNTFFLGFFSSFFFYPKLHIRLSYRVLPNIF